MAELTMPRLSDTMSEGSISRWLKKPGDRVEIGDIIAEIETDKATMELEAFEAGFLQQIMVQEGQVVPIGQTIGMIGATPPAAGAPPASALPTQPVAGTTAAPTEEGGAEAMQRQTQPAAVPAGEGGAEATLPQTQAVTAAAGDADSGDGQVKASPLARRIAEERGVDLRRITGTGPGGRILKENVEEFLSQAGTVPVAAPPAPAAPGAAPPAPTPAAAPAPAPAPPAPPRPAPPPPVTGEVTPMSRMRRAIARAMTDSKPGVPHIYVTVEIDMAQAMQLRRQINDSGAAPVKVSVNDLVVKAAARALVTVPSVNSSYALGPDGQPGIVRQSAVNVSVAVALDDGLIAPVVRDADKKSIGAIAAEIKDMAGRAREGKIKQNELEGATFQVTSLGMYGVVEFGSIITAPQGASLAVGAVRQAPVVREGQVVPGEIMNVTLSADHRIVDGAVAAQYLQELRRLLETPMSLLV